MSQSHSVGFFGGYSKDYWIDAMHGTELYSATELYSSALANFVLTVSDTLTIAVLVPCLSAYIG